MDGVGARKEKERERDGETEREMGRECGRGTRRWASRLSPPLLSLSLSLSAHRRQTQAAPVFFTLLFLLLTARREGVRLWGGEMLAGCGKDGKEEKGKRGGEKESEREPVPKTG